MRPSFHRIVPLLAIAFAASALPSSAKSFAIVRKSGGGSTVRLADSLVQALKSAPGSPVAHVIDLSGDGVADAARVAREAANDEVLFAVGPDAVVAVGEGARSHVIALGVPNPARLRTTATYVSVYPSEARIFDFVARRLGAKKIGFLFSPAHNGETAASFGKAATARGLQLVPMPAGSAGELVRVLKEGLPEIDVLILPVDPLLFDRMNLRLIVERCSAAKKPTVGFLPELPRLGITAVLLADPAAVTAAALREAGAARTTTRKQVEVEELEVAVSRRAAELIGIQAESLGADTIQ